ncbi:hypothetical protein WR25_22214 [Diploscapter pachys]|uniref:Peptidase M20 dimerisation domain-containing protein n=1 Tax=Diploscapter pachys TaxID=2018661 RepID=A0A2A2KS09_9BILA|nr:hypothetical protein WR25_22214 [Diploscapter pachys]
MSQVNEEILKAIFSEIDSRQDDFVEVLREAVAIESVSGEPERRPQCVKMIQWTQKRLEALGATTELIDIGTQKIDGKDVGLPPILFAKLGSDKSKKTVLIYGHLDVQPAAKEDGWNSEPFKLEERDGKLFGRGSTDDKGPALGWLNAIDVMQKLGVEIPVNIKFVYEGMEESGSIGLDETLEKRKTDFLHDVDFCCISDNYWLGKGKPCLTYGLRGICYFFLEVTCAKQDLHSGCFGGTVHEAMNDLVWMMSQLTDVNGRINIPGLYEMVAPMTDAERESYSNIDFDPEDYKNDLGAFGLVKQSKEELLMNRWRLPCLSLHGIEGAFSSAGAKTCIPAKVIGKFSIRIVPNMTHQEVDKIVVDHLNAVWKTRGSPNKFVATAHHGGQPWLADFRDSNFAAGSKALKRVFGVEPDFTREGGSIPVILTFQKLTGKSVMLLPMGASDDMAHSQNEKLNRKNYVEGMKVFATYLLELAHA